MADGVTKETTAETEAPEETKAPEVPAVPDATDTDSGFNDFEKDFDAILASDDLGDDDLRDDDEFVEPGEEADEEKTAQAEEAPAEAQSEEAAPKSDAAPAPDAEASAVEQPTTEGQPAQPAAQSAEAPPAPQVTGEQLAAAVQNFRDRSMASLAKDVYALTPEDVQALEEDPGQALAALVPKLAARVHVESQLAAVTQMARILPQYMQHYAATMQTSQTFEDKFFQQWPKLTEHRAVVTRIAQAYRQVNPSAAPEDVINHAGLQAMIQLNLPLDGVVKTVPVQQQAAPAPAVQSPQQQPFQSVAAQAAPVQQRVVSPKNEFAALAEEIMRDDNTFD